MRYRNAIIVLGVLIAVTLSPFIGVPRSWKEGLAIVFGLLISVLAYVGTRTKTASASPEVLFGGATRGNRVSASESVETESQSSETSSNPQ
jgi:hypothetical protein